MKQEVFDTLKVRARQARLAERMKTSAQFQAGRMKKEGVPEMALIPIEEAIDSMKRAANTLKRECKKISKGEPIYDFVEETMGLSTACFVFLGCLPPMDQFATVSKVWKYAALHVIDGKTAGGNDLKAVKKEHKRLVKAGERSKKDKSPGWSPQLKSDAIVRLAEPCVKMNGGVNKNGKELPYSPYRDVYDRRALRTKLTHPPMLEEGDGCEFCDACYEKRRKTGKTGLDCANLGGHHWKDGHRHADAMRITAKAIILDLWLVENGKEAVVGGHDRGEAHQPPAPSTDIGEAPDAAIVPLDTTGRVRAAGA